MFLIISLLSCHTVCVFSLYVLICLLICVSIDYIAFNNFSFHIEDRFWLDGCWKYSKRRGSFPLDINKLKKESKQHRWLIGSS